MLELAYTRASPFNVDHPMMSERSIDDEFHRGLLPLLRSNPAQFQAKARGRFRLFFSASLPTNRIATAENMMPNGNTYQALMGQRLVYARSQTLLLRSGARRSFHRTVAWWHPL